ncbi:MAG: DNA methylase, partial [Actinobacteria bacterium]|nr:DNA methylase [Actinomycetota bacterium]
PGDIVFDGFCGTGMTGVAARMCGCPDYEFKNKIEHEMPNVHWKERKAILNDLSPAATFISHNYNTAANITELEDEAFNVLTECKKICGWMYKTNHTIANSHSNFKNINCEQKEEGEIIYTVWSDVFICPSCGEELIYWDVAVDRLNGKVCESFKCPNCGRLLTKRDCKHAISIYYNESLNKPISVAKQVPVQINYMYKGKRYDKEPDHDDINLIEKIETMVIPFWYPTDHLPDGEKTADPNKLGIYYTDQFYTRRNLYTLSCLIDLCSKSKFANKLLYVVSAINLHVNKMRRYQPVKPGGTPGLPGTLYVSSNSVELSIFDIFPRKLKDILKATSTRSGNVLQTTQSSCCLTNIPSNSIDYIFTDPPFGNNIMYSELNYLWESWLKVKTNSISEAIINKKQKKSILDYQKLMTDSFREYYRILKPNRWMTVEFHNSKNAVWNAIQEALQKAGFIVADVRTLDKQKGTTKQAV